MVKVFRGEGLAAREVGGAEAMVREGEDEDVSQERRRVQVSESQSTPELQMNGGRTVAAINCCFPGEFRSRQSQSEDESGRP